jgi:hypothetical protein
MTEHAVVVVLAAPGPVTAGVRDVVRDWAAIGLITPVLWVEESAVIPGRPLASVIATRITGTDSRRVRLQDELANTQNLQTVRLVSLGVQGSHPALVSSLVAGYMVNNLYQGGTYRFSPVQLVLTRHGGKWQRGFEQEGWRTLVVAPEDSFSPARPATEIIDSGDDTEAIAHSASALATIAGMWVGMGEGPFDSEPLGATEPRVVRTFLRRLDASLVANDIRVTLTDVSRGLPKPRSSRGSTSYFQNPADAAERMAHDVMTKHQHLFTFQEQSPDGVTRTPKNWWQAILDFLKFLKQVLVNAPRDILEGTLNKGAAAVSRRVQNALYGGADSRYEVVTRGINGRGLPYGTDEIATTARKVAQRSAAAVSSTEQSLPDSSAFWRDFIAGGLTLADAGTSRLPDVDPQLVQGLPGVVPETVWVAPAPGDAFELSGTAVSRTQRSCVSPYDTGAQQAADDVITQLASEETGGGRVKEQFEQWRHRMASSYTGRIGQRLSKELRARQERLAELMAIVSQASVPEIDDVLTAEHERLRRTLKHWILGFFGIVAVSVFVGILGVIGVLTLTVASAVAAIAWLVHGVWRALGHQRKIFAAMNSLKAESDALDYAALNVSLAASALYRVATLYSQYLAWAPILGQFLHQPFGPPPLRPTPARLNGLLPRSVGFGVATPDAQAVGNAAAELAQQVFEAGWLSELWTTMIAQAPEQLGPRAAEIRSNGHELLSDPAIEDTSLLRQWSALVAEGGVPAGVGDEMWRRSRDVLMRRGLHELSRTVFNAIEVQAQEGHGVTGLIDGDTFFTVVTDALSDVKDQAFLTGLFRDTAQAQGMHRVASTVAIAPAEVEALADQHESVRWIRPNRGSQDGLDQFLVVLQLTPPVASGDLTIHDDGAGPNGSPAPMMTPHPQVPAAPVGVTIDLN